MTLSERPMTSLAQHRSSLALIQMPMQDSAEEGETPSTFLVAQQAASEVVGLQLAAPVISLIPFSVLLAEAGQEREHEMLTSQEQTSIPLSLSLLQKPVEVPVAPFGSLPW